ncbi:MAG: SCP2 sterol-binding domain-containing protein [Gammaproteobacteria bacterium]|nr:SCP2 sterol-binding domain-containing protein [Gammaproteobacteria bacterium]
MLLPRLLLAETLEKLINSVLQLSEEHSQLLTPLDAKVIKLRIDPPGIEINLRFSNSGVQILEDSEHVDVMLQGSPIAFGLMSVRDKPASALFTGQINMQGDSAVGAHFQQLFESLDIDWQTHAKRLLGDRLADKAASLFSQGKRWFSEAGHAMQEDISEYLQEESRVLPAKPEAEMFFEDVDELRLDCERLEARIKRLQAQLQGSESMTTD